MVLRVVEWLVDHPGLQSAAALHQEQRAARRPEPNLLPAQHLGQPLARRPSRVRGRHYHLRYGGSVCRSPRYDGRGRWSRRIRVVVRVEHHWISRASSSGTPDRDLTDNRVAELAGAVRKRSRAEHRQRGAHPALHRIIAGGSLGGARERSGGLAE